MASRKKTTSSRQGRKNTRAKAPARAARPKLGGTANDIVGLLLVVLAIAMAVSLLMPSSAPVSKITGEALVLLFGAGALLFPAALLVFALTFFIDDEEPVSGRVAFGLALITVSILAIVSITYPGVGPEGSEVLAHDVLRVRGGYVGGGIAWALLRTVGREVGLVILAGVVIAGIVVCGFSISNAVSNIRRGAASARATIHEASENRRVRRAERRAQRQAQFEAELAFESASDYAGYDNEDYYDEPKTTYLGNRTSSVLTRRRPASAQTPSYDDDYAMYDDGDQEDEGLGRQLGEAVTTLLQRRPKASGKKANDAVAPTQRQQQLTFEIQERATGKTKAAPEPQVEDGVPDFLTEAAAKPKPKRKPTKRTSTTQRSGERRQKKTQASAVEPPAERPAAQTVADANVRVKAKKVVRPGENDDTYKLPPFSMLSSNPQSAQSASSKTELDQTMEKLQGTLREFGLTSRVVDYVSGPLVTTFRIEMGEGERVNKIRSLEDDIALTLAAEKVRIFAPITGTSLVGIEIPNKTRQNVHLGDVLPHATGGPLEVAIGRDSAGKPVIADISKMPHMLVAGTTGSGKSVAINSMIMSLLMRATPKQVRLIMVDPKRVEFKGYNGIPHLYVPVVTEPRQAASALQWAVSEMERRLKVFEHAGARNITVYNDMVKNGKLSEMEHPPEAMPYLVIVIDELSDLMMVAGKDVEASIVRIAQLARAAGIHLVIATQRPSANVVTGLIKSNIDTRMALKVSSGIDSRVILDETGADRLLGNGDMLFKDRGLAPKRVLGCFASDPEIESVVDFIRGQGEPDYHEEILSAVVPGQPGGGGGAIDDEDDPLIWEAAQIVVESQLGSTSGLQRRLKVGYARAGRIMDMLEAKGVVGPGQGSKPREVLLDEEGLENLRVQEEKYREV